MPAIAQRVAKLMGSPRLLEVDATSVLFPIAETGWLGAVAAADLARRGCICRARIGRNRPYDMGHW